SLTLTPMMASRFLRPMKGRGGAETGHGEGREDHEAQGGLILRIYAWSLRFVLRHRILTVLCFFATLGITGYMFMLIPKGFIPSEDRGMMIGFGMAAEGISYEDMSEHMLAVSDIISDNPNVDGVMPVVGFGGSMNGGFFFIKLKERHERKATPEQVMAQLYPGTSQVPGLITFFSNPPPIQVSAKSSNAAYQYVFQSTNTDELYDASKAFLQKLMALPQLRDVNSDLMISTPQIKVRIDRDKAATLGLSAQQIEGTLSRAFASPQITTIYGATDQYQVIMELDPQYRKYPEDLFQLHIRSLGPEGKLVPIEEVVSYETVLGPLQLNHVGQLPGVTISFNTRPGVPLSEATGAVRKAAAETLPPTVSGAFSGTAEEFQKSLSSLFWLLLVALAVIYLILGILYESFIHPVTILAGLPSAALGALVTLHLFHAELQIYAFLGIIMLIGIVKKNAIMMIDFALEAERTRNMDAKEAIYQGAILRFRPIMMTTIAAFAGILPIAVGYGAGGASKQPLGLAVCGGLVVSQLITLLVTPVIYTYFDEIGGRLKRRKEER
ncbi:MAG: efflux RND transporter permease subunit, partial [Desulfobacterales bacterium]|nr:efflux RND transporter permease subunit [Desulfobacterales bacterium]